MNKEMTQEYEVRMWIGQGETSWMMSIQNSGSNDGLIFLFDICDSSMKALPSF